MKTGQVCIFVPVLSAMLFLTTGCMLQVGLEPIEGITDGDSTNPVTVGDQVPVGISDDYPADGIEISFNSVATTYLPTQNVFTSGSKWYWVKSLMTYFDLSKIFVTEDGYKVLLSSQDNLVEEIVIQ